MGCINPPTQTGMFKSVDQELGDSYRQSMWFQAGVPWISLVIRDNPFRTVRFWFFVGYTSGQIIATSHDLTPTGGLVREIPLFQANLGWWNIIICPNTWKMLIFLRMRIGKLSAKRHEGWWYCNKWGTVDGSEIRRENHLGWKKPCK